MNSAKSQFLEEVKKGLKNHPKQLSSKYFYDEKGSRIFQEIMDMPEYYLPRAESEIIETQSSRLAKLLDTSSLEVLELGAGDGRKMVHFLAELQEQIPDLKYVPLDISGSILEENSKNVHALLPNLEVESFSGDFFQTLPHATRQKERRLVVFAGSNIGNFRREAAIKFLTWIKSNLISGDFLVLGVDLKKNPKTILQAYNDPAGITKRFNLNLLHRINRELGGDFKVEAFDHYATYHPITGAAESFLVSLEKQVVSLDGEHFTFQKDEVIQTEISQKYDLSLLEVYAQQSGYRIKETYTDSQGLFAWVVLEFAENFGTE